MAIQNFLSGGFYGKLGDVVGQRWHNKRTIRTHVIPHNPKTEIQQANRKLFSTATRLAQIAYRANRGDPIWDTSKMGQFSIMVGQAKRSLQKGNSESDSIPWYPEGFTPPSSDFSPTVVWSDSSYSFTVSDPSFIFKNTRQLEILCYAWDCIRNEEVNFDLIVTVQQGSTFSWTFNNDNLHAFYVNSAIEIHSVNDSNFDNESIIMQKTPVIQNQLPDITIAFTGVDTLDDDYMNAWFLFFIPELMVSNFFIDITGRWYNYKDQQWISGSWSIEVFEEDPLFLYLRKDNDIDWREGSYFDAWSTIYRRPYCLLHLSSPRIDLSLPPVV